MDSDWWKWWIWIEGPENELDQVKQVVYILHRSFPNPVRTIKDRESKFKLETAGWGVFRIHAKVEKQTGETIQLTHDLILEYPDGRRTDA
jgi:transcription initiation factor IIF auxiliary subunit